MEGQERCEERGGAREVKGGEEGRCKGGERVEGERRDKGGGCSRGQGEHKGVDYQGFK